MVNGNLTGCGLQGYSLVSFLLTAKRLESIGSNIMVTLWHTSENSEAVISHIFCAVL